MTDAAENFDAFAFGGRPPEGGDDELIMALFREWCAAWRALSVSEFADDDEGLVAANAVDRLAEQIYDAPVRGVVGLAIKAFMVAQGAGDGSPEASFDDCCALGPFPESCYATRRLPGENKWAEVAHLYMGAHALRGLLASAASFVPELRPLVAEAIGSPLTLSSDDEEGAA